MNFFKSILILIFLLSATFVYADNHDQNQTTTENEQVNEIAQEIENDEEVPLNDPFAGNEGTNSLANVPEGEQDEPMSIYNFKLLGLISGKDHSYISVVSSAGEAITLTLGQYLGKNQFIDLRLFEVINKCL